jgi:hypothetical protein
MDLVFWMCLFVGCTALPMVVDLARLYFPASMGRGGRLVMAWHWERPVMLSMVVCLCMWAYYAFWESVLPYSTTAFTPAWYVHVVGISALWINSVWNYAICAAVDPGFVNDDEVIRKWILLIVSKSTLLTNRRITQQAMNGD